MGSFVGLRGAAGGIPPAKTNMQASLGDDASLKRLLEALKGAQHFAIGGFAGQAVNYGKELLGNASDAATTIANMSGINGLPAMKEGWLGGSAADSAGMGSYPAPTLANIQQTVSPEQLAAAQAGVADTMGAQADLTGQLVATNPIYQQQLAYAQQGQGLNRLDEALAASKATTGALAANNGAGNQAQVYGQTQGMVGQMGAANGIGNQSAVLGQMGGLNNQLAANNGAGIQGAAAGAQGNLVGQLDAANGVGAQTSALGAQGNLVGQLDAANGVGVQTGALGQQQALNSALAGGVGAQNAAIGGLQGVAAQQAATANQYQNLANGVGPNPVQAALNQATGQNVANQAALMAGQRGAGANAGLMARQIAQQGAATQQQAVGQGATMQAQQQLAALSGLSAQQQAMGNTQQAIGGLGSTQAGMQMAGIGQQGNLGAQLTGQLQSGINSQATQGGQLTGQLQSGINSLATHGGQMVNQQQTGLGQAGALAGQQVGQQLSGLGLAAGQANNQVANQLAGDQNVLGAAGAFSGQSNAIANQANVGAGQYIGQVNTNAGAAQNWGGTLLGSAEAQNNAQVASQNNVNTGNVGLATQSMSGKQALAGGLINAGGGILGSLLGGNKSSAQTGAWTGSDASNLGSIPATAARGGMVERRYAMGGDTVTTPATTPSSGFARFLTQRSAAPSSEIDMSGGPPPPAPKRSDAFSEAAKTAVKVAPAVIAAFAARGGSVQHNNRANDSASLVAKVLAHRGLQRDYRSGGGVTADVPSERAVKPGNSYANDKIPAVLSEGEVVIPRSVMQGKDPVNDSAKFVAKVLARRGLARKPRK